MVPEQTCRPLPRHMIKFQIEIRPEAMLMDDRSDSDERISRCGRRRYFEQEVERLLDRLYGTALRLTRNPDDAEDIVAEAVGKAWAKLDELQDIQCLEGWLFRILHNTFVSEWRRRQHRQDKEVDIDAHKLDGSQEASFSLFDRLHQPFLLWWGTPEEQVLNGLLREDLQKALDGLPDAFRIVVILVEVEGYRYEEVAELLGIPLGTVRSRLSRGRSLLQKALWYQAGEAGLLHGTISNNPVGGTR